MASSAARSALVARESRRELELGACLGGTPEAGEQLAAHGGQRGVAGEPPSAARSSTMRRAEAGPVDIATATARLSSTTGDGARRPSASYSSAMRAQSVSSAVGATA